MPRKTRFRPLVRQDSTERFQSCFLHLIPGGRSEFSVAADRVRGRPQPVRRTIARGPNATRLRAVALLGILALHYQDLKSIRLATMFMLSVSLTCVGGIAAVLITGGDVSLGSLVGFVTVFGVAVRNDILLISHYQHLETEEGVAFGWTLIVRGSCERLAPILKTAASTGLALLPLILFGNLPGQEIEHPMAIVILGGLVSSTFLTLIVVPVAYERLSGR